MRASRSFFARFGLPALFLLAGLIVAAPAARAADFYNSEQLRLLFSGSKVRISGICITGSPGDLTLDVVLNAGGTFSADWQCVTQHNAYLGTEKGTWSVEDDELCLEVVDGALHTERLYGCWPVGHGKYQFGLYSGDRVAWKLSVSHPKFATEKDLLAALDALADQPGAETAAAGPALPPAEFKPLPVGTRIYYDNWSGEVTRSNGFDTVIKNIEGNAFNRAYAVFGREGSNRYSFHTSSHSSCCIGTWELTFDDERKAALKGFWPLTVGKKVELKFEEWFESNQATGPRPWRLTLEVVGTELLSLGGSLYPTFVVRSHASSENENLTHVTSPAHEYVETYWYNPDSGLVLKFEREWIRGEPLGAADGHTLTSVEYPPGTTGLALKEAPAPGVAATVSTASANLPPAEYKPLPAGTRIYYDTWSGEVTRSNGFETVIKNIMSNTYNQSYAVFGPQGNHAYTFREAPYLRSNVTGGAEEWLTAFSAEDKSSLKNLWPLAVGRKVELEFDEVANRKHDSMGSRNWRVAVEVVGTAFVELKRLRYPTFVVTSHAISEGADFAYSSYPAQEYRETRWYNPDSGLVLKFEREWIRGEPLGAADSYTLTSVEYPPGTIGLALKEAPAPGAAATVSTASANLPPAEYKPLPMGTRIYYDTWSGEVTRSNGFETVVKNIESNTFNASYAVFGRQGLNLYTLYWLGRSVSLEGSWETTFGEKTKARLKTLWPLAVGKKTELEFHENLTGTARGQSDYRSWHVAFEVTGEEFIELGGSRYPTFIVRAHASSEDAAIEYGTAAPNEYRETYWYNPDSGLVLKFEREWIRGEPLGAADSYTLTSVEYPPGTTGLALKEAPAPDTGGTRRAEAITLPPAAYAPPRVGTKVKYDDRIYRVTRTDGFLTVYRAVTGERASYLNAYALFGEFGRDLFVTHAMGDPVNTDIADDGRRKLEAFWPLEVGKKADYTVTEGGPNGTPADTWRITLEVTGAEAIRLGGKDYETYVIAETGASASGKAFSGRRWYAPNPGVVVKTERTWTKAFPISEEFAKAPRFLTGEKDDFELVRATDPRGRPLMVASAPAAGPARPARPAPRARPMKPDDAAVRDRAGALARLEREAEQRRQAAARKAEADRNARAAELARLQREAEEQRRAAAEAARAAEEERARVAEAARKAETERKARAAELARLQREAEEQRRTVAEAARKAEAERKARVEEIARLEREAEEKRLAAAREAEAERKARAAETARLAREAEEAQKAEAEAQSAAQKEIARLRREAAEARQALAARDAREATEAKATAEEIARLKKAAAETKVRETELAAAHNAEIERFKREAELADARQAEIARLKKEAADAKAREVQLAEARQVLAARQADEAKKAAAQEAELRRLKKLADAAKARDAEIQRLKREADKLRRSRDAEIARLREEVERFRQAEAEKEASAGIAVAALEGVEFGRYHALVIGIDNYKHMKKLTTAVNDANAVADILERDYGFRVRVLIDPDRLDIVDAFDELQETLTDQDNLLIYYAGHGWLNEEVDRGYWLPVDAKPNRRGRWLSNATITDTLKGLAAKHVMVVADSCYSGTLVRGANAVEERSRTGDYWKQMAVKWARVAITSGGLEPVADKGGGGHSPFAKAFIDALRENASVMDGTQLFSKMRRPVMVAADQTPQYADVRQAGHDGGEFLFVKTK